MTFKNNSLVVLVSIALGIGLAYGEDHEKPKKNHPYLALGDSLAFGFSPLVMPIGDLSQYHGYPQLVAAQYPFKLTNASCYGETSGHFLNLSDLPDLGCASWRASLPLFVSYSPTETQLDYAVNFLTTHKHTSLVTIDIGLNDLGVLLELTCQGNVDCATAGEPGVLAAYSQHLLTMYGSIRKTGYSGPIVAVTVYAMNYSDPTEVGGIIPLNAILASITTAFGGRIADSFTAFQTAAAPYQGNTCATGLEVKLSATTCDRHPSAAGQALIAKLVLDQISDHQEGP
jgi:lysophospholipase L1-like esterase